VYCILGIPIDAINLATVVHQIEIAAAEHTPLLISTPNLNFLVSSLSDPEFRESLLESDLCPPDGAPIVLIARLLGFDHGGHLIVERSLSRLAPDESLRVVGSES
jgi:N-acetylglucosaminyldiphosphoundecaprenol N-acetyl-beta-D-mannosaminyltransferase